MATETTTSPESTQTKTDPVVSNTLASILGLVKPEEATIKPPSANKGIVQMIQSSKPKVETPAENVPVAEEPAKDDAPPAAPAKTETPTPEPAKATKKVEVKKRKSIADEVREAVKEAIPAPTPPAPVTPATKTTPVPEPEPDDTDLTDEEREELETAEYGAKKDPKFKDLPGKLRKFYKEQKTFLEDKLAKAQADGDTYDPSEDPEYRAFLAKNSPKFSPADRKKFSKERIVEQAKLEAVRELQPKLAEFEQRNREIEHSPRVAQRVEKFINEAATTMPEEVVKHFFENGQDVEKTRAKYPLETPFVLKALNGSAAVATEFLRMRKGIANFNPSAPTPIQEAVVKFVNTQGDLFAKHGGDERIRNGKTFVPVKDFAPGMEAKHWTFDDEDVLSMLRVQAGREAKQKISAERARIEAYGYKIPTAPVSAAPAVTTPSPAKPTASPRSPANSLPGAASPTPKTDSTVAKILGLAPR